MIHQASYLPCPSYHPALHLGSRCQMWSAQRSAVTSTRSMSSLKKPGQKGKVCFDKHVHTHPSHTFWIQTLGHSIWVSNERLKSSSIHYVPYIQAPQSGPHPSPRRSRARALWCWCQSFSHSLPHVRFVRQCVSPYDWSERLGHASRTDLRHQSYT